MRRHLTVAAALVCLQPSLSHAQTAVGTGVGIAESNSASGAVAVNRGNGNSSSSLVVNSPSNTTSTATVNSTVSGTTTQNINQSGTTTANINSRASGTTTVRAAPAVVAPGLAAAGLETCLGSASGTISAIGFGIGGGSTYRDEDCTARLDSRTLFAMGLKGASVARLCARPDIWRSMPDVCEKYWPAGVPLPAGVAYATGGVAYANVSATPGVVRVINGKTGLEGDCLNYNARARKCHYWLGDPPPKKQRHARALKPLAVAPPSAANLSPAGAVPEPTKDN